MMAVTYIFNKDVHMLMSSGPWFMDISANSLGWAVMVFCSENQGLAQGWIIAECWSI